MFSIAKFMLSLSVIFQLFMTRIPYK